MGNRQWTILPSSSSITMAMLLFLTSSLLVSTSQLSHMALAVSELSADNSIGTRDSITSGNIPNAKSVYETGEGIVLKVTAPCTRCVMITLPQGDLPQDLGILSTVARYNQVHVGVYASVHHGGTIHRGDLIHIEEG
jgi:hypothetical protein